jgi:hypothetical protein
LITSRLIAGSILYVPGPAPTPPPVACGPLPGWVFYTIQPGDTLYRLSLTFGVSISQLQLANCMGNATHILAGQRIYTPFLPPVLPSHTPTIPPATEPVPSPEPPTTTPTSTSPPPPTATPSPTPTLSPSDTPIIEETPTSTPVIEETPTDTPEVEATPTNSPPEISPVPALSTDEDVAVGPIAFTVGDLETPAGDLQVLANSSDPVLLPESNILAGGSGSDRSVTLAPAADQSGTVTITITVTDKSGSQSGTSFDLLVVPVNDAPVAQDDSSSTVQDTNVAIPALTNDLDVDGDVLQFSVLSDPAHGSVQVQGDGLVYTPDPGYTGDDSFSYTVTDGILESNPATVTVTINPPD